MSSVEPLFARRPSNHSITNNPEEEGLLTGRRTNRHRQSWSFWREIGLFTWAILATIAVIILAVVYQHETNQNHKHASNPTWGPGGKPTGKRNMIFMVSDGMGPASLSMTRSFRQLTEGLPVDDTLVLDRHFIGTSRTRSSNTLVTDSAAGATAFACGLKSYNNAVSVDPNHLPCGTVLEAAAMAGYKTGLVVTTGLTDATPATFASHVNLRQYQDLIALQEVGEYPLGRVVDLMLGGGRCYFQPNSTTESCRADDKDVIGIAKKKGFSYVHDRAGFDALNGGAEAKLPLLGLFARKDIPYEIDRRVQNDVYPSLEEMTRTALKALSQATANSDQGFFLMIEGSRIDHAGHGNDPAAQVHEVLAYDKAFAAALEFLENDSTPGVVVSTSDHETGGLTTARQLTTAYPEYKWLPDVLANASHSAEYVNQKLSAYQSGEKDVSKQREYVKRLLSEALGINDSTKKEVDSILDPTNPIIPYYVVSDMISRRAQLGWSTHGHTAVDVNIYASSSKDAWPLFGNHENTEVGHFLADYLDVDVKNITAWLQSSSFSTGPVPDKKTVAELDHLDWLGDPLGEDIRTEGLGTYHGEYKPRSI